jgi:hypothetical protein
LKTPPLHKPPKKLIVQMGCDGGINLYDAPNIINDNQSSDMLNMWFYDKSLRLRPGLVVQVQQQYGKIIDIYPKNGTKILLKRIVVDNVVTQELYGMYIVTESAILTFDGQQFYRVPNGLIYNSNNNSWNPVYNNYNFTSCVLLPAGQSEYNIPQENGNMTAIGSVVYMFGSGYFLAFGPYTIEDIFDSSKHTAEIIINYKIPYVPTLLKDCVPAGNGTFFEARNFLTPIVKQQFTTDNVNTVYRLCKNALDSEDVNIEYDSINNGQISFTIYPSEPSHTQNGITISVDHSNGIISFTEPLVNAKDFGVKNNLTITYSKTVYQDIPVNSCTTGEWFGDRQGQTGGARLFLSGNPKSPAMVYYSAADDTTYFADNAWITAGDPAEAITAIARYLDILTVLKSNSIYSLCLQSSNNLNLTLKSVNSNIGCDIPKSVQVAGNCLVWACTNGGIYALSSTQIQDERAVHVISCNINKSLLSTEKDVLKTAASVDTNSHYMLFVGANVFVWDYALTPFSNSGDKNKAIKGLAWYIWNLEQAVNFAFLQGSTVSVTNENGDIMMFDDAVTKDSGGSFDAYWFTKAQDFGKQFNKKLLQKCYVGLVNKEAVQLEACNIDDEQSIQQIFLDGRDAEKLTPIQLACNVKWDYSICYGIKRIVSESAGFGVTGFECTAILN